MYNTLFTAFYSDIRNFFKEIYLLAQQMPSESAADIQSRYKNVLIIQTAFLGDVILTTPLIRAVHQLLPQARIDILVLPQNASILANNPHLHETIHFNKRQHKWKSFFSTIQTIRKNRYDLAVSPHSSMTSALLMLLGGIRERLGFNRRHAANYLTLKVPHLNGIHKINKNLHLLSLFGDQEYDIQTELFPEKERIDFFKMKVAGFRKNNKPIVALAPGSVWFTKRWPQEKFTELSRLLYTAGYNLVFLGAPDEQQLCSEIISSAQITALNFAGKIPPLDSAALLMHCDLLLCNDSGAMHIANAVQTDVMAFFGPTVTDIGYFPFRRNDIVLETEMQCRPCGSHGGKRCPLGHHRCMNDISVQSVVSAVNAKFNF